LSVTGAGREIQVIWANRRDDGLRRPRKRSERIGGV